MVGRHSPAAEPDSRVNRAERQEFRRGFSAIIPLWLGMLPFALAYAVAARGAGLTVFETQAMSVIVFAGAAQFMAAGMFAVAAEPLTIVFTVLLVNLRHFLYGLNLGRGTLSGGGEALAAHLLTDEAFGVTAAAGRKGGPYLLGAGASIFVIWNVGTLAGSLLSASIPDPAALGVDFVFPLAFLALLLPLLRDRTAWVVALSSAALALLFSRFTDTGITVLLTGLLGSLLGAALSSTSDAEHRRP